MKKGNPKNADGLIKKRLPMKKEATKKTPRGSSKKTFDEKKATPRKAKGLIKKDLR
jgi:hypothetical protein